jgi:hypothetical protein
VVSYPAGTHEIEYGTTTITYDLVYSDRKDLAIHVYPDGSVVADAPLDTRAEVIEQRMKKRASWITRQRREFDRITPSIPPRQYVSGETHRYLGRQYRLKVIEDTVERVKLLRGYFHIHVRDKADREHVRELMDNWYLTHARLVFSERLAACYPRVEHLGIPYPELDVRPMKVRWGSCTPSQRIILNVMLVQVPKHYIDYVIVHELCHLKEPNHSRAFYDLLDRVMPDWRERRDRLNTFEVV